MCIDGARCSGLTHDWYLYVHACRPGAAFSLAYSTPCCIRSSRQRPSRGPEAPLSWTGVIHCESCRMHSHQHDAQQTEGGRMGDPCWLTTHMALTIGKRASHMS
jgi:hypothetical protein